MKNIIKEKIIEVLEELGAESSNFIIEIPADIVNGDYSTNVALACAKELKENPNILADKIVEKLQEKGLKEFSKIEKAGAGFINFYLSNDVIREKIQNPKFENEILKGLKIILEFTDPNPFKQFHIGHLMTNTIGESLSRILEVNGADVKRLCYQGDIGPRVAKAISGMIQHMAFFPHDHDSIDDKAKFLGDSYVYGSTQYEENEEDQKEIKEINRQLFEGSGIDLQTYYIKGRKWSLEYFDKMYEILGTKFDKFYFESETAPVGKEIVEKNIGTIFAKSDGAVVYKGEEEGLHTRVFINSQGLPTYEAKELGLFSMKEKDFSPNRSIIITGNEQADYFKVVFAAVEKIDKSIKEKTTHLHHGMLRFAEGKMSSRLGNVITAEELINQVKALIEEKIKDRELSQDEKEEIKQKVALGALKYSILKQGIGKDIVFDSDKSVSFEGDSGPYIQYAFIRSKSILGRTAKSKQRKEIKEWETTNLERMLIQYQDVLETALNDLAPQHLVAYLTRVASEFNSFYANNKILDESDPDSPYKILITKTVKETLEKGLDVLGIGVPSKM